MWLCHLLSWCFYKFNSFFLWSFCASGSSLLLLPLFLSNSSLVSWGRRFSLWLATALSHGFDRELMSRDPQFMPHFQVPGIRVDTYAKGGWKVWTMSAHSGNVKLLDPSFIYFQIGGNDVSTTAPEVLACNISAHF